MMMTSRIAAAVPCVLAVSVNAGTVCRGPAIIGFERQAQIAAKTLGTATTDPAAMRIFSATTRRTYYYESNFVRPGQRDFTKIVSETPLSRRQIVQNIMFISLAEVAANTAATEIAMRALDSGAVQFAGTD